MPCPVVRLSSRLRSRLLRPTRRRIELRDTEELGTRRMPESDAFECECKIEMRGCQIGIILDRPDGQRAHVPTPCP